MTRFLIGLASIVAGILIVNVIHWYRHREPGSLLDRVRRRGW